MSQFTTVALPQDADTAPRREDTPLGTLLVASRRSHEAAESGLANEDYVTFRYDERRLAVVVCDGVGQSFFGDLAARFLGDELVEWLWALPPDAAQDGAQQAERLFNDLHGWTEPATRIVGQRPLPKDRASALRRIALERKRESGSACVFACALLDRSANGTGCLAFWLGNTRLRLWDAQGQEVAAGPALTSHEQWSTARGPVNSDVVHHAAFPSLDAQNVKRITFHTDGLHPLASDLSGLSLTRLKTILRQLSENGAGDDVSLVDVKLT